MSESAKNIISNNWRALIKPGYKVDSAEGNAVTFKVEPLESGFGITLANSLRRVLLSSLQGAAVRAVRIENVLHEFSTIPGVLEDVQEVLLQVKEIVLRYGGSEVDKKMKLSAVGPCIVTAGMISTPDDVQVINKDLVLCTLGKNASLEMEFYISTGSGYSPAEEVVSNMYPVDVIAVDAIYSPVRRVNFNIEKSRVGSDTEYDKMYLTVETNGSLSPDLAVGLASRTLQDQLEIFVNINESEEEKRVESQGIKFDPRLLVKIDNLEMSVRARNCLTSLNLTYLGDLAARTESSLMQTPNFGRKSLNEIKAVLESRNLKLGMKVDGWPPENIEELYKKYEDQIN